MSFEFESSDSRLTFVVECFANVIEVRCERGSVSRGDCRKAFAKVTNTIE